MGLDYAVPVFSNNPTLAAVRRPAPAPHRGAAFIYAFDLLELDGVDLRREPLETRKATLASVLRPAVSVPSRITSKAVGSRELCRGLRDYVYGFRGTAHAPGSVFYANDQS